MRCVQLKRFFLLLLFSSALSSNAFARDLSGSQVSIACRTKVIRIDFLGNTAFTATELKMAIHGDRSDRWCSKSGGLNANALADAAHDLSAFFYDNGFLNVKVDEPQIGPSDRVMIGITEGARYRFGSIAVEGSVRLSRSDLGSLPTMRSGQPFRLSILQHDTVALADFYSDRGYAFVNIDPRTQMDSARHLINVVFLITPGHQVRIGRIIISGNAATHDDVIRRALKIREHQLYSAKAFRESKVQLDKLGIFDGTKITTKPSAESNEIDVNVIVVEKSSRKISMLDRGRSE